jgi:ABC-2 type transport system permease protein
VVIHRLYNPEGINSFNIVPGLLAIILSMTLVMMTAMAVTREEERGTMESLLSTPATAFEVMIGKLLPYIAVGLIQTAIVLVLARLLFAVPMAQSCGLVRAGRGHRAVHHQQSGAGLSHLDPGAQPVAGDADFHVLHDALAVPLGFHVSLSRPAGLGPDAGRGIPITHFLRVIRGSLLKERCFPTWGPIFWHWRFS